MVSRRSAIKFGVAATGAAVAGSGLVAAQDGGDGDGNGNGNGDDDGGGGGGLLGTRLFGAGRLLGADEVPAVDSAGDGAAVFATASDLSRLQYVVVVRNVERVTAAAIRLGGPGESGEVAAYLFGSEGDGVPVGPVERGVTTDGILASGEVTAETLVGPLEGRSLSALLGEMRRGNASVSVATEANPDGEIRGGVRRATSVEIEFEEEVEVDGAAGGFLTVEPETELEITEDGVPIGGAPDGNGDGESDGGDGGNGSGSGGDEGGNGSGDGGAA